jgi:hypothetical protein
MKKILLLSILAIALMFFKCKEITETDSPHPSSPANHAVINELFRIDSTKYYTHWWIEVYNPTSARVNAYKWKLRFKNSGVIYNFVKSATDTTFYLDAGIFNVLINDRYRFDDYWDVAAHVTNAMPNLQILPPLKESDEVTLEDSLGTVVSMFRYGNYVAPAGDRFPNNKSFGTVPEWHSMCRFNDAWETGNSSDDFYDENTPIVGWYSQRWHP